MDCGFLLDFLLKQDLGKDVVPLEAIANGNLDFQWIFGGFS